VEAFLHVGAKPQTWNGRRLPPESGKWRDKDFAHWKNTWKVIEWADAIEAKYPRMAAEKRSAILTERHGAWARSVGLSCHPDALRRYRDRMDPTSRKCDGNVDGRGRPRGSGKAACSPEAWEFFRSIYLHQNKHSLTPAWRLAKGEARKHGWAWPSLSTIRQRVRREIPKPAQILGREGKRAFEAKAVPKVKRSYEEIAAGEWWSLDGRTLDLMARERTARGWRRVRPVLAGVLDARSRMLVGWAIGTVEHSDLVAASIKMAIREWGVPEHITDDNGQAYKRTDDNGQAYKRVAGSSRLQETLHGRVGSIFSQLHVTVHTSLPYKAWGKHIESIWRGVKDGLDRFFPSFWGGGPAERPEGADKYTRERLDQLPTLDDVRKAFSEFLKGYHATPQSGDGMHGLSPNLAMQQFRGPIRRVDPKVLGLLCCRTAGPVRVGRDGVRFKNVLYGQFARRLFERQGQDVYLRIDPERADCVIACDSQGVPICRAYQNRLAGCNQEDIRRAARKRARLRKVAKEYAQTSRGLLDSPVEAIMRMKAEHARAEEAELRKTLPPPVAPPSVTIVRPDLAEAVDRLDRQVAPPEPEEERISYEDLADDRPGEEPRPAAEAFDWLDFETVKTASG